MNYPSTPGRRVRVPEAAEGHALEVVNYPAGAHIFIEGTPGFRAYIIQSGLVEISKIGRNGEKVLGYLGGGEVFGELAPLDGEPRMASATAIKDTTCVVMPETLLRTKVAGADPFMRDLLYVLVRGLRQATDVFVDRS